MIAGGAAFPELSNVGAYLSGTADILAAPGPGMRYRIFSMQMSAQVAGVIGGLRAGGSGNWFAVLGISGDSHVSFPLMGLALPENLSVNYQLVAGSGQALVCVLYTVEPV